MNKINKSLLLIIVLVIGLLFILYILPYFMDNREHMETETIPSTTLLSNFVNKHIYVTCNVNGVDSNNKPIITTYYLSVSSKKDCTNLVNVIQNECSNNVPILTKQKNNFCIFQFSMHQFNSYNAYTIRSTAINLNSPNLTQNLNYYRNKNLLCFDNDKSNNVIYFEIEQATNGYLLKFQKVINNKTQYFYVGVCSATDPTCNQGSNKLTRLCLYMDKTKATPFQFTIAQETFENIETFENTETFEDTENMKNIENMESVYSFKSNNSEKTLLSLPGAGNISDANMEDFECFDSLIKN